MSENDRDDEIRATILAKLHRNGFYEPRAVAIQTASTFGVKTNDRGRAKELISEMANSEAYPVQFHRVGQSVYLKTESTEWVASAIRRLAGEEALPWDLKGL